MTRQLDPRAHLKASRYERPTKPKAVHAYMDGESLKEIGRQDPEAAARELLWKRLTKGEEAGLDRAFP